MKDSMRYRILLAVVSGVNTPKKIASKLGTTPQNIYNHLQRLVNNRILVKKGKKYFLADDYKDFISNIHSQIYTLKFKSLYELDENLTKRILKAKECRAYWNHLYFPIAFPEKYNKLVEIIKQMDVYLVCGASTVWDKACAEKYKEAGAKVKLGYKMCFYNIAITENEVFEVFYPKEIYEAWDEIYEITDYTILKREFVHFYSKKWDKDIVVRVDKNKTFVESLKMRFDNTFSELE